MYMNGRGPMTGGHRGPMDGHRPMGYRPMGGYRRPVRMYRPMGFFPFGGLFILPALMFGGWIAVAVLGGILSIAGSIVGGVMEGLSALASGVFSGSGLAAGIVIGLLAFYGIRKRRIGSRKENTGTVDGVEVETQIVEPAEVHTARMGE